MGGTGSGGYNKKSVDQHLLEGTYRKDRHGKKSPSGSEGPNCPNWLSAEAKKEWRRVAPKLENRGLLTKLDMAALAAYCQSYAHLLECEERLKDGLTYEYTNKNGSTNIIAKPEVNIAQSYIKLIHAFCSEFGFTPSSWGQMEIPENPGNSNDPVEEILKEALDKRKEDELETFLSTGEMEDKEA